MFHHNILTTPHEKDASISVKVDVLMIKKSCVILGSKALV